MKSNKQRRKEINFKRIARAEKLREELEGTVPPYALGNPEKAKNAGFVLADASELQHNNTHRQR